MEIGLPVLRRLLGAARRNRKLDLPVLLVPFGSPEEWFAEGEPDSLLRGLAGFATHTAPPRLNALAAKAWLREQWNSGLQSYGPVRAGGFWRHHCVAELRKAVASRVDYRLTTCAP